MLKYIYISIFIIPILISCQNLDEAWHSYQSFINNGNREELIITNVTAQEVVSLKSNVTSWKSQNIGHICYSVGLADTGIEILISVLNEKKSGFVITTEFIPTTRKPKDVIMFHNRRNMKSECILVITFFGQNKIKWMKIVDKFVDKDFWSWTSEEQMENVSYFRMAGRNILFITTNSNNAFLYEFDINSSSLKRWFLQNIQLESPATLSTFNHYKTNYFLSVLQPDQVSIFMYQPLSSKFSLHSKLQSLYVNCITSFNIGFKSFLGINGNNASIYEFSDHGVVKQNIENSHLNGITFWLPVPIQTYRDEVLLVAQRTVDHATHINNEVDIFTYNGHTFEEHEDIPCFVFGENTSRLNCLTYNKGLSGSNYIVIEDAVGLLTTRPNNSSIIFTICYTLRQIPNPTKRNLYDLLHVKETLKISVQEKIKKDEDLANSIMSYTTSEDKILTNNNNSVIVGEPQDLSEYSVKINRIGDEILNLRNRAETLFKDANQWEFKSVIINGKVKFEGDLKVEKVDVENIDGLEASRLLPDIVRRNNITGIMENKIFKDIVTVDCLQSSTINEINSNDIIFADDSAIVLNGDITFKKPVLIENVFLKSGKINNVDFEKESIIVGRPHEGNLAFDDVNVMDNLRASRINDISLRSSSLEEMNSTDLLDISIPHNVTVTLINGQKFTDFIHSICLTNLKCTIPGKVKITNKIEASEIITNYLNDLKFPEEYISRNSKPEVNITGRKHFAELEVKEIAATRFVNEIDTRNLITASTKQHLGNKTFRHFSITDELKVDGKIVGNLVKDFLPNQSLLDSNVIKADAVFKNLKVGGNIFIESNFNRNDYHLSLQDLVYHDNLNATISGLKKFPLGFKTSRLDIDSGFLSHINLSSIVTQDTNQQLNFNVFNASVKIQKLFVHGTYENTNITELENSLIKLEGNQFINSSLHFDEIGVNKLEISGTLNNVSHAEYLFTDGGRLCQGVVFNKIIAENITINGNITGNISNIDLKNLSENYLSGTRNQSLRFNININESTAASLFTTKINGIGNKLILNEDNFGETLVAKLNTGNITVKSLEVTDSIEIKKVNNKSIDNMLPNNLHWYLNRTNSTEVTFENDIYLPTIIINQLGFVNWEDYIKQIVFKNETNIAFSGNKTFQNGMTVEKLIETKRIRNIFLKHILTKEVNQTIVGPIQIEGDVTLKDIYLEETMNGVLVSSVLKNLFVSSENYRLKSDVIFRRLPYINSLKVLGKINDKDIAVVFEDTAFKDDDLTFGKETIFKEPVVIFGNLAIKHNFNRVKFSDLISNIVLTTTDADINSLVTFSTAVFVQEKLTVDENLSAHTIGGFNVSNWIDKSISLEKGLIRGNYTFEHVYINNNLITEFVNDINMKKLVPLSTNQTINYMEFNKLKFVNDIFVGKTVNHLYLPEEINKTLMKHGDQEIHPKTIFKNIILVRQNLNASSLNNQNTSKLVTTNTNQILTSNYNFTSKSIIDSNLQVDGSINKVDFKKWKTSNLKLISKETQLICNNWNLENITFLDDVHGIERINDFNLNRASSEVEDKKNSKLQFEHTILDDYRGICDDVTFLYDKSKSQIYKLKYFEDFQTLILDDKIKMVTDFVYNNTHYLLVNKENCMTDIYMFNGSQFIPMITNIETDQFEQIVPVVDEDILFLVARGNHQSKCDVIGGTNIWVFNNKGLKSMFNMEHQDLIQESLVPSTFYTIGREGVIEHNIKKNSEGPVRYRKWKVFDDDAAFVPRGLETGLAIRTGKELIYLERTEPVVEDIHISQEVVIEGSVKRFPNTHLPGRNGGDIVVLNVGTKSSRNYLLAVASHENTIVRDSMDFVKIYDNPITGAVFDKVLTYKPSSLLSIEFGQGETLLAFLENKRILRVYEYKGIEGFEHRISFKLQASDIFKMDLSVNNQLNPKKIVGAIDKNKIRLLMAVMDGSQISDKLHCEL